MSDEERGDTFDEDFGDALDSKSYSKVAESVQSAHASGKKHRGHRRDFEGRVFPKAAMRKLANKANVQRMAAATDSSIERDTYSYLDRLTYDRLEKVLYDAIIAANPSGKTGSGKKRVIKERHMLAALERHNGGLGFASEEGRKSRF